MIEDELDRVDTLRHDDLAAATVDGGSRIDGIERKAQIRNIDLRFGAIFIEAHVTVDFDIQVVA